MLSSVPIFVTVVVAYLLGSIPFGYLLVRRFRGTDVRSTGSGNIGATNVARTSPLLGILTLVLDAAKGLAAVGLTLALYPQARILGFIAAFCAIYGHVFPVWLGFRGGKGVATGLGSFVLLTPKAILIAVGVFLAVMAAFRWVALSSIVAAASLPLTAWLLRETLPVPGPVSLYEPLREPLVWTAAGAALIILKHHSNLKRMLRGQEPRFELKKL